MIEYEPRNWLKILFRMNGSVLPRFVLRVSIVVHIATGATYFHFAHGIEAPNSVRPHTVVDVPLIAYGLFGIDELRIEIEEPFG